MKITQSYGCEWEFPQAIFYISTPTAELQRRWRLRCSTTYLIETFKPRQIYLVLENMGRSSSTRSRYMALDVSVMKYYGAYTATVNGI